ncbi:SDR family NAD(P)-dependent oxidoreductase [Bacillus sp. FJAT-29814]|uniref:SDR family NAD(P)-dependent oxidoreductase n=1 Tax=Bacillus sp. FJAT-29814 TaxID=1729688 RepID=UPI000832AA20|nr:glucose 1-dehydrogenase [Bacillus sp. FJAT-29814]
MKLLGRVAVVTGGAKGIGKAVSMLFAEEGAAVVIADLDEETGKRVVDELAANGHKSAFVKTDVADEECVKALVEASVDTFGKLDIMIANAGIAETIPIHNLSLETWNRTIDVNLTGVFLTNKYAIKQMLSQGHGVIVNTASMLGHIGRKGVTSYTASKGGVANLTRTLGVTYASKGIRVNAVCPGYIDTDLIRNKSPEEFEELIRLHPIGRLGQPEEIAKTILFLASDDSSFICGANLMVDGGFTAQ